MTIAFIVGSARSGTTSMLEALKLCPSACCRMEPAPNLNIESRDLMEGRLADPYAPLIQHVCPRVAEGLRDADAYVEKQISLIPFMEYLAEIMPCKFVITRRDGRDVAASLVNWHNQMFPIIYQECAEEAELSQRAREVLDSQDGRDPFDYSLPRPRAGDPWRASWSMLSRFEMVSWYWARINRLLLEQMEKLPPSRYIVVDYTNPTASDIRKVYEFLELDGSDSQAVTVLLHRRVNSLADRVGDVPRFPKWADWTGFQRQRFLDIAFGMMSRLGYMPVNRPAPEAFGDWWREDRHDEKWYEDIYQYRRPLHEVFRRWIDSVQDSVGAIDSVVEVGCGIVREHAPELEKRRYTGIDLAERVIEHNTRHNTNGRHSFICSDIITSPPKVEADLVFAQATIDNVYDMNAFLRAMARMTRKVLYVANYRGYFPDLADHRYRWDPKTQLFFNDLSPRETRDVLRREGFKTIAVFPQATHRGDIPAETIVIASREALDESDLMVAHEFAIMSAPAGAAPEGDGARLTTAPPGKRRKLRAIFRDGLAISPRWVRRILVAGALLYLATIAAVAIITRWAST